MAKTILLAEDHPEIRLFVKRTLERVGYNCQAVVDGEKAVTAFVTNAYDLLIMDGSMPNMDGFEATRQIRAYEAK